MNYEKEYKSLVVRVKKAYLFAQTDSTKKVLEDILPALRESEDDRIRKEIITLYSEIETCISELLNARTDKDSEAEGKALFKMEGLMVATLQDLSCIKDYLEKQKKQKPSCWNSPIMTHEMIIEKPNDLEEAAKNYTDSSEWLIGENLEHIEAAFIDGAKWQEEQDLKYISEIHRNGYNLCKEQMMNDAVEGRVISNDGISFPVSNEIHRLKLMEGDRVKIVIVKEEKNGTE